MEAVSHHYDSDDHSQEFQSDDEDEVRDRLANVKVERKVTNPKKVDESREKFVPRRQAPQTPNPANKVSIFDNFPNVCYSEWFTGKSMREIVLTIACVAPLLDEVKPHILFLQETKCKNKLFSVTLKQHANYQHYICGEPQFNGVATLTTIPATDVLYVIPNYHDSMYRYMELTILGIRFINIYAPQGQTLNSTAYSSKVLFNQSLLERLDALLANNTIPFIVGDFNIIPSDLNLFNPTSTEWQTNAMVSPVERHWFQQILKLGYTDLFAYYYSDIGRPFTWWLDRQAYMQNHGWRIDLFLVPTVYLPYAQCPLVHHNFRLAEYADEKPSNHAPISLTITLSSISYLTGMGEDEH
jgi:exodeoxyribonuclease-3